MRRYSLLLAAGLALTAAPALAQSWGGTYDAGHEYDRGGDWNAAPSAFDWRGQLDRPGDYRCDAFWDANRTDCGAGWRDQRRYVSTRARRDYRDLAGHGRDAYGHGHGRYGQDRYDHATYGRGYGYGYGSAYGYSQGGAVYYGAYGRPDLVYPAGGRSYGSHGSYGAQGGRADWCRANYRSYDPYTGYYRAYSGRLIYCG